MASNKTIFYLCIPQSGATTSIALTLLALPFHILMMKILAKDVELSKPRHQIMFCLSVADALQIFSISSVTMVMKAFDLTTESGTCHILRDITIFTGSLTVIVTSLTLVTLAVERMIVCMYFLKYHIYFTRQRTTKVLVSYWVVGIVLGAAAAATNDKQRAETIANETASFQIISVLFILPPAIILTIIQARLFLFSKSRFNRVVPANMGSGRTELPDFKKKQIRIAFVAGVVSVAYIVCMVPIAMAYLIELVGVTGNTPSVKAALISLAMANTLADPFIYGFGMLQTRQLLIRKIKNILPSCLPRS